MHAAYPLVKIKNLTFESKNRPTPSSWNCDCTTPNDNFFLAVSSLLGTVHGYSDLQGGRLIQDIFPIRKDSNMQIGSGSIKLELHTEDPALEYRADFLGFMCISNLDRIPTLVSIPKLDTLDNQVLERLSRPVFRIFRDRPSNQKNMNSYLVTPILFRNRVGRIQLIYDPIYIVYEEMSPADREAFSILINLLEGAVSDFLLEPGEIGFIDNYRVAHGRPQYKPRYDGTDRWLKRTQISRQLRESHHSAIISGMLIP